MRFIVLKGRGGFLRRTLSVPSVKRPSLGSATFLIRVYMNVKVLCPGRKLTGQLSTTNFSTVMKTTVFADDDDVRTEDGLCHWGARVGRGGERERREPAPWEKEKDCIY